MFQSTRGTSPGTGLNTNTSKPSGQASDEVPDTARDASGARGARPPAFALTDLSKIYDHGMGSKVTAADHLSMTVSAAQVIGLLDPTGAGKTTTRKMMCGLNIPTSGRVCLNGYDVAHHQRPLALAVRQVAAVLQGTRNASWSLPAWQNLMDFGQLKALRATEIKPHAKRPLTEVGLWDGSTRPSARSPAAPSIPSRSPPW